jgi:hypothetical protein
MIDVEKLPALVVDALSHAGFIEEDIANMRPREVLEKFLQWEGIIGYDSLIWNMMEVLIPASRENTDGQ